MADPLDKSSDTRRGPHPFESGDGVSAAMNAWRIKTLDTVLTVAAALGLVSLVSYLVSEARTPGQLSATLSFFAAYVVLLTLAFQRRLPWRIRGWGFLLIAYAVGIIGLARGGLAGAGREYLMIIPILAVLLIGARAGMATAMLSLLIMIAFAFAVDGGSFRGMLIYLQNPVDLASWLQEVAYTAVLMGVGTALLILFNRYLLAMLGAEHKAGQDLAAAHAQLEEYNAKLEQKVSQRTAELDQAYQAAELANRRMEQELALAGQIQASFMSSELPQIDGWQLAARFLPARHTSGDFYDVYPLGRDRYGILVADVVDKGVGAALFMALCWALVHTYASDFPDQPEQVMHKVNERLLRETHGGQFVTLFYGVLDARLGRFSYCNAGHNPPYLFSPARSKSAQRLELTGIPLGILEERSWSTGTAGFQPGDMLVLYTDGVTDAENGAHEFFGTKRLIGLVQEHLAGSVEEVGEALVQGVSEFIGHRALSDDVTLVILRCLEHTASLGAIDVSDPAAGG